MRQSWNEVRARAAAFARDWKDEAYEKGETQSFCHELFRDFGGVVARLPATSVMSPGSITARASSTTLVAVPSMDVLAVASGEALSGEGR